MKNSIKFEEIKNQWMMDPDFRKAYDDLEECYLIDLELIRARMNVGLTQEEITPQIGTIQPLVST